MGARATGRQVLQTDRAHFIHSVRMPPNVEEPLLPHISGRQRKLYTREDIAIRRYVTARMARATRQSRERVFIGRSRDRTKLVHIADESCAPARRIYSPRPIPYRAAHWNRRKLDVSFRQLAGLVRNSTFIPASKQTGFAMFRSLILRSAILQIQHTIVGTLPVVTSSKDDHHVGSLWV
jgi:hypothetical protein